MLTITFDQFSRPARVGLGSRGAKAVGWLGRRAFGAVPLPLLAVVAVGFAVAAPEPAVVSLPARWAGGWVDATATLLPAHRTDQMIAPMPMDHSPQVQVVLQLRNTTGHPVTVPFEQVRLHIGGAGGNPPAEVLAGARGPRTVHPGASVEERLRYRAPHGAERARLVVPGGGEQIAIDLPVLPSEQHGPPATGGAPHGHGAAGHRELHGGR